MTLAAFAVGAAIVGREVCGIALGVLVYWLLVRWQRRTA